jgi:hypothetical protein
MSENIDREQVIRHCEELIRKIKDIVSAKIITTPEGKISEIHVIANSKRNPKQIVRDIESAIIASFGSEVDHKKISVAQLNGENQFTSEIRLKVEGIEVKNYQQNYEVTVALSGPDGNSYEGRSSGPGSYESRMRTVAVATLEAIRQYLKANCILSLEDIIEFKVGGKDAMAVLISFIIDRNEEHFLGSALVKHDRVETIVAAVLNAVNRKISFLVKEM